MTEVFNLNPSPGPIVPRKTHEPILFTIKYEWIKREILRRCHYLPQDIEDALDDMDKEQYL